MRKHFLTNNKFYLKELEKYESRSMQGQLPVIWNKAKDSHIYDLSGKKIIDFTSTIFVSNTGHSNKFIINKVIKQLKKNLVHTYAYVNKPRLEYLKSLVKFAGKNFEKAFLMSAGTEATEAALKLMRMYGQKINKKKIGIICFEGNWHGRTMGAQLMSGNPNQKKWIGHKDKNIFHIPFPYPWVVNDNDVEKFLDNSIKKLKKKINLSTRVCGVMIETFQGWGAIYYPRKYIQKLYKICKKNNILICFDEMQAGFARTGYNFGYEYYGIKADLICCGKGMGGGFPVSGVIGKKKIMDLPDIGEMSSTHSANPISCVAGLSVLQEIKKKKLNLKSKLKGNFLHKSLETIKNKFGKDIIYIGGKGLIASIVFKNTISNKVKLKKICENCLKNGLLVVYTGRESIKIGPPLTISLKVLKQGINILDKAITEEFK